jgi:hypothetical protein
MEAVDVANEPHVNNRHSPYALNPKLSLPEFHAIVASTRQNVCSLVFLLLTNRRPSSYTIANQLFLVTHHCHSYRVIESHCLRVCTRHLVCFNIGHQIFVFNNREVAFTFKFHLSSNKPPTGKREVLTSFALIACNVISWNIWCAAILVGVN